MAAHAKRSLSASKRRYACPGSVVLEADFPDTPSKYASAGTAMHALAQWCLANGRRAEERIAQIVEGEEITEDMAELTQGYVDHIRAWAAGKPAWIEQRVDVSSFTGQPDQFGTADAVLLWDDELVVVDLKTGYRAVSPTGNTQLMLYALGALKLILDGQVQPTPLPGVVPPEQRDPGASVPGAVVSAGVPEPQTQVEAEGDLW